MLTALLLVVCGLYSGANWAHGHLGFYFGAPIYPYYPYSSPYYYPYQSPYYYPPTIITIPVTPPTYIQRSPQPSQQYPSGYWYYCNNPKGYYPYVKQCSESWQEVEPVPSTPR
ncbi:MAG TPA: hypothetical protein VIF37_05465 [Methylobacter sp.]|jgi:hypothetical protein